MLYYLGNKISLLATQTNDSALDSIDYPDFEHILKISTILISILRKWMKEQILQRQKCIRKDNKLWRAMVTHILMG